MTDPQDNSPKHQRRCERLYESIQVDRRVRLPKGVVRKVLELIRRPDVQSVSCPYDDPALWRELVAEQVKRASLSGQHVQDAFTLYGPDGGLWDTPIEAWGGYVHIPFEGLCHGDLLLRPKWLRFSVENGTRTGKLSVAASVLCCHYVLSPEDFGEVSFATRERVGDWVLYTSNKPYKPCRQDPRGDDIHLLSFS
ncbi:MAG: hypothetical protein HYZ17_11670 [Betaproteobacteria bacterium]|nr:hypothetical protein [Betaproteobacteria bacterium]